MIAELTGIAKHLAVEVLVRELEEAIGRAPRGLTDKELDSCWQAAKNYWQPEWEACRRIKQNGRKEHDRQD